MSKEVRSLEQDLEECVHEQFEITVWVKGICYKGIASELTDGWLVVNGKDGTHKVRLDCIEVWKPA